MKVIEKKSLLVASLAILMALVKANILELSEFRLAPLMLVKKQDFTFSGGTEEDEMAAISFNLSLYPQKTQPGQEYALLVVTAD